MVIIIILERNHKISHFMKRIDFRNVHDFLLLKKWNKYTKWLKSILVNW